VVLYRILFYFVLYSSIVFKLYSKEQEGMCSVERYIIKGFSYVLTVVSKGFGVFKGGTHRIGFSSIGLRKGKREGRVGVPDSVQMLEIAMT
jgi:hypothetical protein